MKRLPTCIICYKKQSHAGHCAVCRRVQDTIRYLHDKYPGISPPAPYKEQMIQEHTARIQGHLHNPMLREQAVKTEGGVS